MGHAARSASRGVLGWSPFVAAFRQGLADPGFEDGRNVAIEFRWAEGQGSRLPALAADLAGRQVSVIVSSARIVAARAAKAARAGNLLFRLQRQAHGVARFHRALDGKGRFQIDPGLLRRRMHSRRSGRKMIEPGTSLIAK